MPTLMTTLTSTSFLFLLISMTVVNQSLAEMVDGASLSRFGPEKKSTDTGLSSDFMNAMSAMNGATRLRYGKRSNVALYNDLLNEMEMTPQQQAYALRLPSRWAAAKRMAAFSDLPGMNALVDQLNGSERLRFGRK